MYSTATPLSFRAAVQSERVAFAETFWGRAYHGRQGRPPFGPESSTPLARCTMLTDHLLRQPDAGGRRGAAHTELRARGAAEDEEEHDDDDSEDESLFPLEIRLYPDTDDEGEPHVRAARDVWPTSPPARGCGRAPAVSAPPPGALGARHRGAPAATAPRRPPGIRAAPVRAERRAPMAAEAGGAAAERRAGWPRADVRGALVFAPGAGTRL
ncbi:unnamed protein product [Prorocentrum cordatum]|uniref:Selenoprotein O n=1 Tax=Prorocentrum cordatum TaxID=2364126 RepID=A0ABN9VCV5_9DINO|nr:unnamed protein product [Polarella glacialis]